MIKKAFISFLILIAGFAIFVAMQPSEFRIVRSATIDAPAKIVFNQVNNLRSWKSWSPWAKLDPNMKASYKGKSAGVGAVHTWSGNDEVGEGHMKIIESKPNFVIKIKLDFVRPFKGTSDSIFTFKSNNDQETLVTWEMSTSNNFIGKLMHLIMDCDEKAGKQFEQGLAELKKISETKHKLQLSRN